MPLLNGVRVLRELDHAASLLAQGRNWSYRETQLERPQYLALRDLLVEKRFLYPMRARQPVRWTADRDGGGLALLETATSLAHTGVARHLRALRAPASTPHACAAEHNP